MKKIVIILVVTFFCQGCAAALVAGAFYSSAKNKKARQEFVASYQKANLEREEKGLQSLDFCEEAIRFDKRWAGTIDECKGKLPQATATAKRSRKSGRQW